MSGSFPTVPEGILRQIGRQLAEEGVPAADIPLIISGAANAAQRASIELLGITDNLPRESMQVAAAALACGLARMLLDQIEQAARDFALASGGKVVRREARIGPDGKVLQ